MDFDKEIKIFCLKDDLKKLRAHLQILFFKKECLGLTGLDLVIVAVQMIQWLYSQRLAKY